MGEKDEWDTGESGGDGAGRDDLSIVNKGAEKSASLIYGNRKLSKRGFYCRIS